MTLVHAQSVGIGISPRGRTSRTSLQRCCCACRSKPEPLAVGALLSCESLAVSPPQATSSFSQGRHTSLGNASRDLRATVCVGPL